MNKQIESTNHKDDLKFLKLFSDKKEVSKGINRDKTIKTEIQRYYLKDELSGMVIKRNGVIETIFIYE